MVAIDWAFAEAFTYRMTKKVLVQDIYYFHDNFHPINIPVKSRLAQSAPQNCFGFYFRVKKYHRRNDRKY